MERTSLRRCRRSAAKHWPMKTDSQRGPSTTKLMCKTWCFQIICAPTALESAAESIYDHIGEAAEDAFNPPKDARDELDAILSDWCKRHFSGERYWRCRGRERELIATAEDVARVGGDA